VVDNRSPLYSYVALASSGGDSADDGLVEAWEIMNLPLKARLVVLSACETARGQHSAGEGVIGLMWAVFVAGSPATLVSQWKVDSSSSTTLMVAFHKAWNGGRSGVSKARALQSASLDLLRARDSAHPFHWAGYILAGDPR
jgi:CHAT domain-containing protein